jgi:acetyl esterase/lipase
MMRYLKHKFLFFNVLAVFSCSIGSAAPQSVQTKCPDWPRPLASGDVDRYRTPRFERVLIEKDLTAGETLAPEGKGEKILLDLYAPDGDREALRPVLLLIHGGGFKPGTTKTQGYLVTLARAMSQRGYACVVVEYRVRSKPDLDWAGTMRDCLADVALGLAWIRTNAGKYRMDQEHIAVIGGSAGGMIGLNSVSSGRDRRGVFAFVNLWGSPNHEELWPSGIDACYPPTLTIHGTKDETVPFAASAEFSRRLTSAGVRNLLVPLPDAPHTPLSFMDKIVETVSVFLSESLAGKEPSR